MRKVATGNSKPISSKEKYMHEPSNTFHLDHSSYHLSYHNKTTSLLLFVILPASLNKNMQCGLSVRLTGRDAVNVETETTACLFWFNISCVVPCYPLIGGKGRALESL